MPSHRFNIGDNCVCLHKDATPYEAKVIGIKQIQGKEHYVVHFKGWNSRHDEKIPIDESSSKMFRCTIDEYKQHHQGEPSEPKTKKMRATNVVDAQLVATKTADTSNADNTAESVREEAPTSSVNRISKTKTVVSASEPAPVVKQPMFAIGENCVCIQASGPHPAKIVDIKDYQGVKKYLVHYVGWNQRYDEKIPVGEESGQMFKGTIEEYNKKYGGETSEPAPSKKKTAKKDPKAATAQVEPQEKEFTIVSVTPDHADHLIGMIHELADFEKMKDSVVNTADNLRKDIKNKAVHGFIAFDGDEPAGMNLFYFAYSTWVGQYLHMEDLYVRPQFRRQGLAKALWKKLAQLAKNKNIQRLEWAVLDWNKDAIALYDSADYINLTKEQGWFTFRMDGAAINKFADE